MLRIFQMPLVIILKFEQFGLTIWKMQKEWQTV